MTILLDFLQAATAKEREQCAARVGTTVNYLYQVAGCHRPRPGVDFAVRLEDATGYMSLSTGGRLPAISARDLATMCAIAKVSGT